MPEVILIILVIIIVTGFAHLYFNGLSGISTNRKAKAGQIKVACVGDSITYGHGITNWKENNYPAVLQKLLGEKYHVANFGSSGSCVNPNGDQPYTSRAVYPKSLGYDADILVFMLGTNDSKPQNWTDTETFMKDYNELLGSYLKGEKPSEVYVCICAESFFIEETESELAKYDIRPAVVDEIAKCIEMRPLLSSCRMEIVDIHTLTSNHPEWFEKDGVHPNNEGARGIAEMIAAAIKQTDRLAFL